MGGSDTSSPRFDWERALLASNDGALTATHIAMALVIGSHIGQSQAFGWSCWPSHATLARELRVSRQWVGKLVDDLREAGWLSTETRGNGQSLRYRLASPDGPNLSTPNDPGCQPQLSPPANPSLHPLQTPVVTNNSVNTELNKSENTDGLCPAVPGGHTASAPLRQEHKRSELTFGDSFLGLSPTASATDSAAQRSDPHSGPPLVLSKRIAAEVIAWQCPICATGNTGPPHDGTQAVQCSCGQEVLLKSP